MRFSIRDSRLVSVGVASVIAVSVIGFGNAAFAQDGGSSPTPPAQGDRGVAGEGHARGHRIGNVIRHLLQQVGLTREEVAEGKAAGLTWGQILDQYGDVSAAEAKQQALDALEAKLDAAVASGRLTREQADRMLEAAGAAADRFLNSKPGDRLPGAAPKMPAGGALETVAGVIGVDAKTLVQRLASGETLAQIAGEKTQAVIDALIAEVNAKVDEAVAKGKLTPEEGADKKAKAAERITTWVNEGGPLKGPGRGFGHGPKGMGGRAAPSTSPAPTP